MTRLSLTLLTIAIAGELVTKFSGWLTTTVYATIANGLLLVGTLLLYRLMSEMEDPQKFTQVYLLSIVGKIILACVLIVILILLDKPHARVNVIFLFSMYVIFTVVEVLFLVKLRSSRNGPKKNQKISF